MWALLSREYSGKDMPYSLSMGKACGEAFSLGVYRDGLN